jgi:hypothetical protein
MSIRDSRNAETLADFVAYCKEHPSDRFWQALRNWSGHDFIYACDGAEIAERRDGVGARDTFYWEGKSC